MLSEEQIRLLSAKNQATESNTLREYVQNIFLSNLYKKKGSERLLFKGGTALRIAYGSPRYSEDLDYTSAGAEYSETKNLIEKAFNDVETEGLTLQREYSKTSGGLLVVAKATIYSLPTRIEINVSSRQKNAAESFQLISNPYMPAYTVVLLAEEQLVAEKIQALLSRQKSRDYYDLYFILRSGLTKKPAIQLKKELLKAAERIDNTRIVNELKTFLPPTHWPILRNLRENVTRELQRL